MSWCLQWSKLIKLIQELLLPSLKVQFIMALNTESRKNRGSWFETRKKCIFNPLSHPFLLKQALTSSWVSIPEDTNTLFCADPLQQLSGEELPFESCQFLSMQICFKPVLPRILQRTARTESKMSLMGRHYSTSWEANCTLDVKRCKWKKWIKNCMGIS